MEVGGIDWYNTKVWKSEKGRSVLTITPQQNKCIQMLKSANTVFKPLIYQQTVLTS